MFETRDELAQSIAIGNLSAQETARGDAGLLAAQALEHRRLALSATVAGK
ncbi:MAG: hypothetical protein WA993_02585 [Candidatus Binatus sp.]|jgi:hypothetical protein